MDGGRLAAVIWVGTVAASAGLVWLGIQTMPALRALSLGWKLLIASNVVFVVGIGFILRGHFTGGPYRVSEVYPIGNHLQAWQVSMGFAMVAFGILFSGAAFIAGQIESLSLWGILLLSWAVFWLPHGVIAVGFAFDGQFSRAHPGVWKIYFPTILALMYLSVVTVGFWLTFREAYR